MLLVLMTLEKCFAVYFPLKSKTVCTVRTAKWATGVVGFIVAGYDSVEFFVKKSATSKWSGLHYCVTDSNFIATIKEVDSYLH